ncbi:MAG: CsbD family protein [Chloroflexi bacterium]|nr:MAG: CsbD family protein [Chloroflexota bacterium]
MKGASTRKREGMGHLILRRTNVRNDAFGKCNPEVSALLPKSEKKPLQAEECSRVKDQLQGKAEELRGKATGNRGEQAKGKMRQAIGNMKRTARDIRDDVRAEAARRREREREKETGRPTTSG